MILICTGIAVLLFAADVVIKQYVEDNFRFSDKQDILGGKSEMRKVHNYGFAMNLLDKKPNIVKIGSIIAGVLLLFYQFGLFLKKGRLMEKLGCAIALGGAFSNMYDRIVRGYVVDYIGFKAKWKKLNQLTFNLGDFCIFLGAFIMLIFSKKD